jgi:hypothetical protein
MAIPEQEIRLMDDKTFESFVYQVLSARYPNAGIKKVDGSGGDQGIDAFQGTLAEGPAIWQFKRFEGRVGPDQKDQILGSIETAFRCREISSWTLCVSIDFRTAEYDWFQSNIVKPYSQRARIELITKADLVGDVSKNPDLARIFFPETAIANLLKLEERILGGQDPADLREIVQQQAEHYLRQMTAPDPRLKAVMSFSQSTPIQRQLPPECLFTIFNSTSSIHFVASDHESLRRDPITLTCSFRPELQTILESAFDTGEPIALPAGSMVGIECSSPAIQSVLPPDASFLQFEMLPPPPGLYKDRLLRLVSGRGSLAKTIPFLRCSLSKCGRKEATFAGHALALRISIKLSRDGKSLWVDFGAKFGSADVRLIRESLIFLYELEGTGRLEIFDLEANESIYRQHRQKMPSVDSAFGITPVYKQVIQDAAVVADYLNHAIYLPETIDPCGVSKLRIAATIIEEGNCSNANLGTHFFKREHQKDEFVRIIRCAQFRVRFSESKGHEQDLFGSKLRTAPYVLFTNSATFEDPDDLLARYLEAQEGDSIPVTLSLADCKFSFSEAEDDSALITDTDGNTLLLEVVP